MPTKKPKKKKKRRPITTLANPAPVVTLHASTPVTSSDPARVLQRAYNHLLARHSYLHSTIESRALVPIERQPSYLPMTKHQYDDVQAALADAQTQLDNAREMIALAGDPRLTIMVTELVRTINLVKRSSAFVTAREILSSAPM